MTALPNAFGAIPPGVDVYAYLNWLSQNQRLAANEANRLAATQQSQIDNVSAEYQRQQDLYRQDLENRYLDILEGHVGTRNRILGDVNAFGESLVADTNKGYRTQLNNSIADMSRAGLLGSTHRAAITRQNETARQDSLRRVQDTLLQNRIGADERLSGNILNFMERRQDVPPNLNQLIELQRAIGAGGAATALPGGGYRRGQVLQNPGSYSGPTYSVGGTAPALQGALAPRTGYRASLSYPIRRPAPQPRILRGTAPDKLAAEDYIAFQRNAYHPDPLTPGSWMYRRPGQTVTAIPGAITNAGENLYGGSSYLPIPYPVGGYSPYQGYHPNLYTPPLGQQYQYQRTPSRRGGAYRGRGAGPVLDASTLYDQVYV